VFTRLCQTTQNRIAVGFSTSWTLTLVCLKPLKFSHDIATKHCNTSVSESVALVDRNSFPKKFPQLNGAAGIKHQPNNALRHSYASYHLAAFINPTPTAHRMGHVGGTEILHGHYEGLVPKCEAEKFWALRPCVPVAPSC